MSSCPMNPGNKYKPFVPLNLPNRQWPSKVTKKSPIWTSVDLRDGNQALVNPMSGTQKLKFFQKLVETGFKEIEVSFPSSGDTDYSFTREIIEKQMIPDDVWIQVLTPAREELVRKTFECIKGAKHVIMHMYNASSPLFRDVVFGNSQDKTIDLAVRHTKLVAELMDHYSKPENGGTQFKYEYSPETFTQTEPEFSVRLCNEVRKAWGKASPTNKIIFNLPATVEVGPPNHYADLVEYFCTHVEHRDQIIISLHPHNDRGCAVAAAEMGLLAGADRIEGCLLGNGERTGNVDIVTLALNQFCQGIAPGPLDMSDIQSIVDVVSGCNDIPVHPRHPYAGELVFTAFSGSHQDAIKKGFKVQEQRWANGDPTWEIPYLPVDPADLGCTYEAVIRVNSQSGKGGIAYLVAQSLGLDLPRKMQVAFYGVIQQVAEKTGKEMVTEDITRAFCDTYHVPHLSIGRNEGRLTLKSFSLADDKPDADSITAQSNGEETPRFRKLVGQVALDGKVQEIIGRGNGALSALCDALSSSFDIQASIREYSEHAVNRPGIGATPAEGAKGKVTRSQAASYVELVDSNEAETSGNKARGFWGVGIDTDVTAAGLKAILSAASNLILSEKQVVEQAAKAVVAGNN
ncbi:unnamed protein product [Sympodiomycopsis kandeliae]